MKISGCPTCGSDKIELVRGTIVREFEGTSYTVPDVTYHACPDCGEKLYDRDAMRKIEAKSPAYKRRDTSR